jgi:vacuolar-type H+-ATPase subunit I/STV1
MEKFEEKVFAEFAKLDYAPTQVERFDHLLHSVREFLQYAGGQQYYGDVINKKIFLLILDADDCAIRLEQMVLQASVYHDEVQKAVLTKREPKINEKDFQEFKKKLADFEKQLNELCEECRDLISKIKAESKQKSA